MSDSHKWQRGPKIEEETGQSMVEFALAMIFIILPLLMVFIESSVILYKYVALTNAAREGARAGSIYLYVGDPHGSFSGPDAGRSTAVSTAVQGTVGPIIPPPPDCAGTVSTTSCQISYGPASAPIPDPLRATDAMTVTLAHTHTFFFGALGNPINIHARSSMRIEPSTVITITGP
jgi:Flp pilus assembly protein TadG